MEFTFLAAFQYAMVSLTAAALLGWLVYIRVKAEAQRKVSPVVNERV